MDRYPIFWGLTKVGALPNPDPTDVAQWNGVIPKNDEIVIDSVMEATRGDLRCQAQEWAGLNIDPNVGYLCWNCRWLRPGCSSLSVQIQMDKANRYPL